MPRYFIAYNLYLIEKSLFQIHYLYYYKAERLVIFVALEANEVLGKHGRDIKLQNFIIVSESPLDSFFIEQRLYLSQFYCKFFLPGSVINVIPKSQVNWLNFTKILKTSVIKGCIDFEDFPFRLYSTQYTLAMEIIDTYSVT